MQSLKSNYDRVLLVVAALLALVFGAILTMKALALPDRYERADAKQKSELGDNGEAAVKAAVAHLALDPKPAWDLSSMPGVPQKKLPFIVSPPIWVKDGAEIDLLDPASPRIREGLDNAWAHQHGLDVGRDDIERLDNDNDGFTNLEEFEGQKTDPNDPESHPAFTDKLRLVEVKKDLYTLTYRTGEDPASDFGIREETELFDRAPPLPPIRRRTHYKRLGQPFGLHPGNIDRYTLQNFQKRVVPGAGAGGGNQPAHVLTVQDAKGEAFQLQLKVPRIVSTDYAVFRYSLPGYEQLLGPFKKGDKFKLPNVDGVEYELLAVDPSMDKGASIRELGPAPKDIAIPAGKLPAPAPVEGEPEDPAAPEPGVTDPTAATPAPLAPVSDPAAPAPAPEVVPAAP